MHYGNHIIRNFPQGYPFWKKIWANLAFFFGRIVIYSRRKLLNKCDIQTATKLLRKGDVVLVGGLRRFSSFVIRGPITHVMLCVGKKGFVHAVCDGVEVDGMDRIFREYDTLLILRPKTKSLSKINRAVNYAVGQIGVPFDYEFENDKHKFYCSELVFQALESAGIKTGVRIRGEAVHPMSFINNCFDVVCYSHNLKMTNGAGSKAVFVV